MPIFDIFPSCALPPLECGFGVSPIVTPQACFQHDAARSRAALKFDASNSLEGQKTVRGTVFPTGGRNRTRRDRPDPGNGLQATRNRVIIRSHPDIGGEVVDPSVGVTKLVCEQQDRLARTVRQHGRFRHGEQTLDIMDAFGGIRRANSLPGAVEKVARFGALVLQEILAVRAAVLRSGQAGSPAPIA